MGPKTLVRRAGVPASRGGAAAATAEVRARPDRHFGPLPAPAQLLPPASPPAALPQIDPILAVLADGERHFRTLIDLAADGIMVIDTGGRISLANTMACQMTGYGPAEIVGLELLQTYSPAERELGRQRLAQVTSGTMLRFERELLRKDGSRVLIEASVAGLPNGESQSIMRDISARKRVEEGQQADAERLRALVRLSEKEAGGLEGLLDATLEEVVALSASLYGYVYLYDEATEVFTLHAWSKDVMAACRIRNPVREYALRAAGLWGEAVRQRRPVVVNDFADASPLKRGYPEGHAALTRFMTVPVFSRGAIVAVVGVANKLVDYSESDVGQLTQLMDVVWKMVERERAEDDLRRLAAELERRVEQRTNEIERANMELEAVNIELTAANDEFQSLLREQERLQAELAYRAMHDPLTGLANRTMFGERLDQAFRVSERGVAVVWIDLDHFKEVNDIFGHEVGDEMLVAVADRLRDVVRETDDIARMGGDEFAVVLPNVVETEAQMVAERVLTALTDRDAFRLQMGASVGIGWQRTGSGDGLALIRRADQAMYRAKQAGGGMAVMY